MEHSHSIMSMKCTDAVHDALTTSQNAFCSLEIQDSHSVDVHESHDHPVFFDLPRANGPRLTRAPTSIFSFEEQVAGDELWNGWDDETFMYLDGLISLPINAARDAIQDPVVDGPASTARYIWESSRTSMSV